MHKEGGDAMKFKWTTGIGIFLGIFIVLALLISPVFAQYPSQPPKPGQPTKKPTIPPVGSPDKGLPTKKSVAAIKAQIKPELIKINKRNAIQFKPFTYSDFKDPKTGQTLKPDQIVTLSHVTPPRQIRGGQFISEINQLEKDFNTYGYTYRDPETITIGEMAIRKELLKTQADRIMSKTKKFSGSKTPQPLNAQAFKRIHSENMAQAQARRGELKKALQTSRLPSSTSPTTSPAPKSATKDVMKAVTLPSVGPPEFKPFHQEGHWNESYGDPDLYAIHQDINMVLDGQKERLTLTANNEIGITILNTKFTIVGGTADLRAPGPDATDSNVQGNFSVKCLGAVKRQIPIGPTSNQPISGSVTIIDLPEVNTAIPLPIPIDVSIGYAGTIAINYDISLTPLAINCQITPVAGNLTQVVNVSVPVLLIVSVGYEGRLLLLTDRPTLIGELSVKPTSVPVSTATGAAGPRKQAFFFKGVTTCFDNFTALRGSFYITFTVNLIFWEKKWKFLIYDNVGFEHYDFLFDETHTQVII